MPAKLRNRFSTVQELLSKRVLLETLPRQVLERLLETLLQVLLQPLPPTSAT